MAASNCGSETCSHAPINATSNPAGAVKNSSARCCQLRVVAEIIFSPRNDSTVARSRRETSSSSINSMRLSGFIYWTFAGKEDGIAADVFQIGSIRPAARCLVKCRCGVKKLAGETNLETSLGVTTKAVQQSAALGVTCIRMCEPSHFKQRTAKTLAVLQRCPD